MRKATKFLVKYCAYFFVGVQLCLLTMCDHWTTKWILLVCLLAVLFVCASFDKWLEESRREANQMFAMNWTLANIAFDAHEERTDRTLNN